MLVGNSAQTLEKLFIKSIKSALTVDAQDYCAVESIDRNGMNEQEQAELVVFTISSFVFKLFVVFHLVESEQLVEYFSGNNRDRFYDAFSEYGNMCCGSINRGLTKQFPFIGLSTPYRLKGHCGEFIKNLKSDVVLRYSIKINQASNLFATVCVHTNAAVEFVENAGAEEEAGSIELF